MAHSNIFQYETPNLILYVPVESDANNMVEYLSRNEKHFCHCSPNYQDITQIDFWKKRYESTQKNFENKVGLSLLIKHKNHNVPIVGDLNFDGIMRGVFQACFLGFRLDKKYEGNGYMHEALSSIIPYIFNNWKLHRIMANHRPENNRSGNLLTKLGFKREGYAEKYLFIEGEWRDHVLTALTNHQYTF